MRISLPNQKQLKEFFDYNPKTGIFSKIKKYHYKDILGPITRLDSRGYITTCFNHKKYYVHRLIFIWMTGDCPETIDHQNGIGSDNRWYNLRPATLSQNQGNSRKSKTNTSGYKGVSYNKKSKKWVANIGFPKQFLGTFDTKKEAFNAYKNAARKKYGQYARFE